MPARRHRDHPRRLLVEGETDKSVIPYLLEANGVAWPDPPILARCSSSRNGSVDEILKPEVLELELAASGLEVLGVVVDANGDAAARWDDVRPGAAGSSPISRNRFPPEVWRSSTPTVCGSACGSCPTIGSPGCWRTFSSNWFRTTPAICPSSPGSPCRRSEDATARPFRNVHERKAELHTWLAWQDPPGLRLHEAVEHAVLDPARAESQPFVNWFKSLFDLCSAGGVHAGTSGTRAA